MKVPRKKSGASKKAKPSEPPSAAKKPSESKKSSTGKSPSKQPAGAKKKTPKQAGSTKKSAAPTGAQGAVSALKKILDRMRAQIALPENQNCVWVVELVIPPGAFMARRIEKPVDSAALNQEITESIAALQKGNDPGRHRFLITKTDTGGLARQYAKAMCEEIPNPTVPLKRFDLFTIDAVLHAQFIGDEEY